MVARGKHLPRSGAIAGGVAMRKIAFLVTILALSFVVGCVKPGGSVTVRGNVVVSGGVISVPVADAVVRLAGQEVPTDSSGAFLFPMVPKGSHVLEVRSVHPAGLGAKGADLDGALIYTQVLQVGSRDLSIPITVSPIGTVLRFGDSSWQLAFYATPPEGAQITEALLIPPAPREPQVMTPHRLLRWHVWWNITSPEPGLYTYRVTLDNGNTEEFGVQIDENIFLEIQFPVPLTPLHDETIYTLNPTLTFALPGNVDAVYIHLRAVNEEKGSFYPVPQGATSFTIPSGRLSSGTTYLWAVHTVDKARVLPWTEAISTTYWFTVGNI